MNTSNLTFRRSYNCTGETMSGSWTKGGDLNDRRGSIVRHEDRVVVDEVHLAALVEQPQQSCRFKVDLMSGPSGAIEAETLEHDRLIGLC